MNGIKTMNVNKININQSEQTYNIASDIYDVSANNNDATFESLSSLLSSSNLNTLIPTAIRCGGMTIRFVQSSDNRYVQYRLMANTWSTTVADWQGVDDEPNAGSNNLIKSGGVANAIETETARAKAAEEANTNAIHKGVDAYFAFSGLTLTDTQISFVQFSFVYVKDPLLNEYVRYTIKPGTYDLPNTNNLCLYVTPSITDDSGNLIPTVSTEEIYKLQTNSYIIGICNSIGKFFLSDASAVYQANLTANNKKWVEHYFVLKNTKVTDTTISFSNFSFLYVKNLETNKFVRYIIEPGTYELSNASNRALYVSTSIKSENNYLMPTTSETEFQSLSSDCYPLGIFNSNGKFQLSDAAAVYSANKYEIDANKQEIDKNKQEIDKNKYAIDIITSAIELTIPIGDEILRANKPNRLLDDGSLMTVTAEYICVSDFINIENRLIKNIKAVFNTEEIEGRNVAFAFYSDKTEDSFIESSRIYNGIINGWRLYDGDIVIPEGAKYIRISGNTALYPNSPSIELATIDINRGNSIYANAPASGYEYFTYDVDTSKDDIEDAEQSSNILYPSEISKDNGLIRIPDSYTPTGKPTRLIIWNHGAGGQVTNNSAEGGNSNTALLLQKKGYAVLFINGVPEAMRNTKYMAASNNGAAAHMGGWVYIRSALAAYKYVTDKYNIAKDGCFIVGVSMGGVTTLNLSMCGAIPVKAIAINAPVIDSFHDAYFSGTWSSGTLGGKNPAIFAWIYQWDYCNFENDTYTIPIGDYNIFGNSYKVETEETKPLTSLYLSNQDMAILWYLNENKMQGYNGYKTGDFLYKNIDTNHVYNLSTDNDDEYFAKKLPCPCKIWFGDGDTINQISIAKRFVNKCRNGGSIAMLRTCPTSTHGVWGVTTDYEGNDISVEIDGEKYSPYTIELINWLNRWDGNA